MMPAVSVLVPAYNAAGTIAETLESVVRQSYAPIEILVLDDGSADDSAAVAARFEQVQVIRRPSNLGQFQNVNDGVRRARGELIAVYHADDVYDPDILSREVDFLQEHSEAVAVGCRDRFTDALGRRHGELRFPKEFRGGGLFDWPSIRDGLLKYGNVFLRTPGLLVRRSAYERAGTYDGDRWGVAADLDMWVRIGRIGPMGLIDEALYDYRHTEASQGGAYQMARTSLDASFEILDQVLETEPVPPAPDVLAAYEARRSRDFLLLGLRAYAGRDLAAASAWLDRVKIRRLMGSPEIARGRLLALYAFFGLATRLPYSKMIGARVKRRWFRGAQL